MKTPLPMKTSIRLSSVLLAAGIFAAGFPALAHSASISSTYTYDAGVSDWYTAAEDRPAFTKYIFLPEGATSPFSNSGYDAQIRVSITSGVSSSLSGAHAGATWVAPTGEQIVSVTFTYGAVLNDVRNLSIWGGNEASFTMELGRVSPTATTDNRNSATALTYTVPEGTSITTLQLRAWDFVGAVNLTSGWYSRITSVIITTEPLSSVPEPSSCALLLGLCSLGTIWTFRRKS
ncbi:MAG: PEP-CTERM sorting domain-containing protein [Opitutaceae bacterium]|jgi:hypothetical protein|nr:PEP-CTERM sorting domain-containing protein [Opitutaceae bacterium]